MKSKPSNELRIIGGEHRSRVIKFPDAEGLRPTAGLVREKLFNWLGQDLTGLSVLDLFAGSGALTFEAASRNADHIDCVESNKRVALQIKKNIELLRLNNVSCYQQDALKFLEKTQNSYNVVFLDPPYVWEQWNSLWSLLQSKLKTNAYVYIESGQMLECPDYLRIVKKDRCGVSRFVLAQFFFNL